MRSWSPPSGFPSLVTRVRLSQDSSETDISDALGRWKLGDQPDKPRSPSHLPGTGSRRFPVPDRIWLTRGFSGCYRVFFDCTLSSGVPKTLTISTCLEIRAGRQAHPMISIARCMHGHCPESRVTIGTRVRTWAMLTRERIRRAKSLVRSLLHREDLSASSAPPTLTTACLAHRLLLLDTGAQRRSCDLQNMHCNWYY